MKDWYDVEEHNQQWVIDMLYDSLREKAGDVRRSLPGKDHDDQAAQLDAIEAAIGVLEVL